jgi:hypothetical protein
MPSCPNLVVRSRPMTTAHCFKVLPRDRETVWSDGEMFRSHLLGSMPQRRGHLTDQLFGQHVVALGGQVLAVRLMR